MKKYVNGKYIEMTPEEITDMRDAAEQAEAEEKRRPLSSSEVQEMLVRQQINTLTVDDQTALRMVEFYPEWAAGVDYTAEYKVQRIGKLWRCLQAHTAQADWTPDATPAMWAVIDKTHAGTIEDPIPAKRGMEYEYGKYYLDCEDGNTYLCQRTGEAAGGTVVLQYMPHELVGNYFEAVTA